MSGTPGLSQVEWGSPCLKSHVSEFVGTDQSRYMLGFPDMMGSTHLRCWLWGHPACRSEGALPAGPKPTHVVSIFLFQRVGPHLCPLELPSLCQPLHGSILEAEGPEKPLPAAVADDRVPSPPDKGWLPLPLYTRCAALQGSRPFLPELHALEPCPHPSMVSPSLAQTLGGRRGGSGSSVVSGKPMSFAQPSSFTGSKFSPLSTLCPPAWPEHLLRPRGDACPVLSSRRTRTARVAKRHVIGLICTCHPNSLVTVQGPPRLCTES